MTTIADSDTDELLKLPDFAQLETEFDREHRIFWCHMRPSARACFSKELLQELGSLGHILSDRAKKAESAPFSYFVLASRLPGIFNLGGDLSLFRQLVIGRDHAGLRRYAYECIELQWQNHTHLDVPDVTTIALVQGEALGGGFEAALFANVLIAERGARMGLPEILFNLFPGMGAFSILSRKLDPARAERMILSGRLYCAEELFDMGVVDVLAEPGSGREAVLDYVVRENRTRNGIQAIRAVRAVNNPITLAELREIADVWTEAALRLSARDLRMMERLVARQTALRKSAA